MDPCEEGCIEVVDDTASLLEYIDVVGQASTLNTESAIGWIRRYHV